ncbi:MAG TPA: hypothetical protein PLI05_01805 [Methanotrichaceae archaeon]|nr:hypothetical protein [Methanotrichaceae archaeon]HQF15787.1 hypothetical protein [Methanotrichaceae archaeon]HQI90539.1 hypothetical protein [Methanotrichaceae archaeon]
MGTWTHLVPSHRSSVHGLWSSQSIGGLGSSAAGEDSRPIDGPDLPTLSLDGSDTQSPALQGSAVLGFSSAMPGDLGMPPPSSGGGVFGGVGADGSETGGGDAGGSFSKRCSILGISCVRSISFG